jgi:hypothetical protein
MAQAKYFVQNQKCLANFFVSEVFITKFFFSVLLMIPHPLHSARWYGGEGDLFIHWPQLWLWL